MSERPPRFGLTRPSEADIRTGGFSTPWDAPHVPPFPMRFRDAEVLTFLYRTAAGATGFLAPPPLEATGDLVAVHVYRMNDTDWLGPYFEANVMFAVALPGTDLSGCYSPYLFLSSDVGVSHGREVHGQPKRGGEPRLEVRGDLLVGTIRRNGIDVFTGTLAYKQRPDTLESLSALLDFSKNVNLKAVDHIDGRPAIRQLTARRLAEVTVHECWSGPCSVEVRGNVQAPLFRLPPLEPVAGFYWRADFTLVPGTVVHDYLAAAE